MPIHVNDEEHYKGQPTDHDLGNLLRMLVSPSEYHGPEPRQQTREQQDALDDDQDLVGGMGIQLFVEHVRPFPLWSRDG